MPDWDVRRGLARVEESIRDERMQRRQVLNGLKVASEVQVGCRSLLVHAKYSYA